MRTYLIFIFLFTIFLERSDACSCRNVTKRFIDHLSSYKFVGLVEVIGIDTIKDHDYDMAFTIVRVLKEYHDNKTLDTLYIPEGDGGSCNVSIKNRGVGNRFILKGYLYNKSDWEADLEDFQQDIKVTQNPQKALVLSLCDENTICIKDSTVIGNITRNNEIKRARKYVGQPQEMDTIKVERLLRRHL